MAVHAAVVEAGDSEIALVLGGHEENLLPAHEDVAALAEVDVVAVVAAHGGAQFIERTEFGPMFYVVGERGVPVVGAEEVVDVVDNLATPKCQHR